MKGSFDNRPKNTICCNSYLQYYVARAYGLKNNNEDVNKYEVAKPHP